MAAHPLTTSRRALLGAAAVALAAATAGAAPTHPDAALLAACEELKAADRLIAALDAAPACSDAEMTAAVRRWYDAMEAVSGLVPTTPEGVRAKARAALVATRRDTLEHGGQALEDVLEPYQWLAYRLAEDIVLRLA